jgi:hypothetical protein
MGPTPPAIARANRVKGGGISLAPMILASVVQPREEVMSVRTSTALAIAFLGMFAGSAAAQETLVAKVPFPFVVRGSELPAGRYEIIDDNSVLVIRGLDNSGSALAIVTRTDGQDPAGSQPALVFVRHENEYLLSRIWESDTEGLALPKDSVSLRRHVDQADAESSVVLTAMLAVNGK